MRTEEAYVQWIRRYILQGRVQVFTVDHTAQQAAVLLDELQRLQMLDADWQWSECAVLAYTWGTLMPIRAECEQRGIPLTWGLDGEKLPSPSRIREIAEFLRVLEANKTETLTSDKWLQTYPADNQTCVVKLG